MALIGSNIFIGNNDEQMFIGTDRYNPPSAPTLLLEVDDGITFIAGDRYGDSVAVGNNRIVVGIPNNDDNGSNHGRVNIFDLNGNAVGVKTLFGPTGGDFNDARFGKSVAVGNNRIVVGTQRGTSVPGDVFIYNLNGEPIGVQTIQGSQSANNDYFGYSVAVGSGRIVVGAPRSNSFRGKVYIFDLDGNEVGIITASDPSNTGVSDGDQFGISVAVGSGRIVVGAYRHEHSGLVHPGAAYIYDLDGQNEIKLTSSNASNSDLFGLSVAVGSGRIVVGSPYDDTSGTNYGAVYIYDLDGNEVGVGNTTKNWTLMGSYVAVSGGTIAVGGFGNDIVLYDLNGDNSYLLENYGNVPALGSGRLIVSDPGSDVHANNAGLINCFTFSKSNHILDTLD